MSYRRVRNVVLIDSRDRNYDSYPSASAYTLHLPRTYRNVIRARVASVEVPTSFHVFSAALGNTSARFVLYDEDNYTPVDAAVVTIADGNYTSESMQDALMEGLDAAFVTHNITFTTAVAAATARLSIQNSEGRVLAIDTRAYSAPGTRRTEWGLAYFLGFKRGELQYCAPAAPLAAPHGMQLNPYNYILLDVAELNTVDECGADGERGAARTSAALAKVPLSGPSYSVNYLQDTSIISGGGDLAGTLARLDRVTVRWRFHDGRAVDFHDIEHSFSLVLDCAEPRGASPAPLT